jgi:hypothetical protein
MAPILFTAALLIPFAGLAGPFALLEARTSARRGRGRHRRVVRGRHAARGGQR